MLKVYAFSSKLQVVNAAASFVNHRTRKTVLLSICNQSFVFGANHFTLELGSDYMYPFSFENVTFLLRIPAIVHTCTMTTITENATFRKRSPESNFLKTPFNSFRVNRQKRSFSKTLTSHYHFQAKTIRIRYRMDANFFENGIKKLRFQMKTDTCGQGLVIAKVHVFQDISMVLGDMKVKKVSIL